MTAGIDGNTRQASRSSRLGPTEATICIFQLLSMHIDNDCTAMGLLT